MKIIVSVTLFFAVITRTSASYAQGGIWTWMHGSNTGSSAGSYGTKGVAAATNEPPARYQACYWTDKQGDFWLFGGVMSNGQGNDLWKYDVTANMWTWMNGPNVVSSPNPGGVYGTKGIPSANNYPAGRGYGANCWTDNNGDLWLYGGFGAANDLWKYNIASNQWTWVNGNQTATAAVFGTMGVAAATNTPGNKAEVKSAWVDAANNLWMFGGQDNSSSNTYNTLWKYDVSTDLWTWMNGSSTANSAGSYGTYRVEAATNQPKPRWSYTRWKDASDNMYLFAGTSYATPAGSLNDVWRYRPSTNAWTWISGTNNVNDTGHYPPQKCKFYDNYFPPSRYENQTAFSNNSCSKAFWTFGGFGAGGYRNDLWLFEIDSFKWSWVSGSSQPGATGSYGVQGTPAAANVPPGKFGQCMWIDKKNNLWLFGGFTTGSSTTNDLWRFAPDSTCINLGLFSGSEVTRPDTTLCLGEITSMHIGPHQSVRFTPGTFVTPNRDSTTLTFSPKVTTGYTVIVAGGNCRANDTLQFTIHVSPVDTVKLRPPVPLVICTGDSARMKVNPLWTITVTPNTDVRYQATGGSQIVFYPGTTTTYLVVASDSDPCAISPDSIRFTIVNDGVTRHLLPMTDTILCKGDTAIYQVDGKLDYWTLSPATYYAVSSDSTSYKFFPPVTTSYKFIGIKQSGCNPHDTLDFTIHRSGLKASFTLAPRATDLSQPVFQLTNTSLNATQSAWYHNDNFVSNQTNATVTITDTGRHCFMLVATDAFNCVDTARDCGMVIDPHIYVPSAFSPNGDGRNDWFKTISKDVKILQLFIYNRFGERVFVGYSNDQAWDGSFHGKPCDVGTYFYFIKYSILDREPVMLKGDLTLIR